jgi:hypothetical protein
METQNVTLALPKDLLLRVKLLAVRRETSVSNLLTQVLINVVEQDEEYVHAQRRYLQQLNTASDLGTKGNLKVTRDELHERG